MMKKYIIENKYQKLTFLNYGATIYLWETFSDFRNIVISNQDLKYYITPKSGSLSNTIGRVANRIKGAKFTLNNKEYHLEENFPNAHGHGGSEGFFSKKFSIEYHDKTKIIFKYHSPDKDANYPGALDLYVTYELKDNEMILSYKAIAYDDTILNVTNHAYFNLSSKNNILNHEIKSDTYKVLETDNDQNPTGKILNYENKIFDLRFKRKLSEIILDENVLKEADGINHYFLFNEHKEIVLSYKNLSLKIKTSYPGAQIYTMQSEIKQKLLKRNYEKYLGIAIECQFEPDAINHKNFSSIILRKGKTYNHYISYTLSEDN